MEGLPIFFSLDLLEKEPRPLLENELVRGVLLSALLPKLRCIRMGEFILEMLEVRRARLGLAVSLCDSASSVAAAAAMAVACFEIRACRDDTLSSALAGVCTLVAHENTCRVPSAQEAARRAPEGAQRSFVIARALLRVVSPPKALPVICARNKGTSVSWLISQRSRFPWPSPVANTAGLHGLHCTSWT
jgi:hypothetical protein